MKIVGVTSCSTGIAHTYMAAEGIKKAAKKLGYKSKIETQGSIGTEDKLSEKDIADADLIIISSDVSIAGKERFDGLDKVYKTGSEPFIVDADNTLKSAFESIEEH
ncbi:fructose PTS transporter subunit IIB [Pediococcus inopinatus]|uniref:PTS fructose transporter subunit IIB n=1 Tax=Pediococcus inopinatus TaxID=114090 RepID=UPI002B2624AF|nr:fructose PTS transporter subunit IIB [Pediococcus inopinatus]WPC18307.1 fructose PTS transporter subunit IIB [Pediococcus inopinatus]